MPNELIINVRDHETRVALLEDNVIAEIFSERKTSRELMGNIYRGRVSRVLPGMQAAFVDIGIERTAFLYVSDIHRNVSGLEEDGFECRDEDEASDGLENGSPVQIDFSMADSSQKGYRPQIDDLLREGQTVMVQISKEPHGEKGARLTSYLSIPGRHLVLMPTVDHVGVSRLISDQDKKERLKKIIHEIRPANVGFIARTASENASKETIKAEMDLLLKLWQTIKGKMDKQTNPGLLYKDLPLTLRMVRDLFSGQVEKVVVDSYEEYEKILEYINRFSPELRYSVERYDGVQPIFDFFNVEKEIRRALDTRVQLKSGAHLIIERTEALTSIDVNTGRYVGKNNLEETTLRTNLEAVKEIARQLRLRSIGGIIVIDFISMQNKRNGETVYEALKHALANDRAKTNVLPMSELGLIEMTRKRTRPSLSGLLTEPCMYCKGKGQVTSKKEICYGLLRDIEKESVFPGENGEIVVSVNKTIGDILKDEETEALKNLEKRLKRKITIVQKEDLLPDQYKIYT